MGLYPQPNKWQCGPFALKHGLIMLGRIVDENRISRIAGTHWWAGTDEIKLSRAAKAYNCELRLVRRKNALRAKHELLLTLKKGFPALLCVDQWNHWITVVGTERDKFVLVDSREAPVVQVETWHALKRRWAYCEQDPDDPTQIQTLFDLHPIVPKFRVKTKAHFSVKRARFLRRAENRAFARHWDEYFTDLSIICTPRTPRSENVLSLGELLRRHQPMISEQITFWHGSVRPERVAKILRNLRFVADTYDLVVRSDEEKRAIASITALLMLWSASKFGVGTVYGNI
jgi:hypothetical protein